MYRVIIELIEEKEIEQANDWRELGEEFINSEEFGKLSEDKRRLWRWLPDASQYTRRINGYARTKRNEAITTKILEQSLTSLDIPEVIRAINSL